MLDMLGSLAGSLVQPFAQFALQKYGADRQHAANEWALREQTNLANTAHQREVADLKAAGLNPILSGLGGGGADMVSAQGAQQPDFGAAAGSLANNVTNALAMRNQLARTDAEVRKMDADAALARTQSSLALLNQDFVSEGTKKTVAERMLAETKRRGEELENQARTAALPGVKLEGKMAGSPGYRALSQLGSTMQGLAHALTFGMAFRGLHNAGGRSTGNSLQNYGR